MTPRVGLFSLAICVSCAMVPASHARTDAPAGPKPVFVPGLYETESRNAAFPKEGVRSKTCLTSVDAEAFRRETIARYSALPQFKKVCHLSESRPLTDGFAFAMDCDAAETIIAYRFAKDLVQSTTETRILSRPEYSSAIMTVSRRIGPCPATKMKPGTAL